MDQAAVIGKTKNATFMIERLGDDIVLVGEAERRFVSHDIWARGELADFVLVPETTEQMIACIKAAHEGGIALSPRGGGMSYTKSSAPDRAGVGIVDTRKLNRIVEINADDMYVTVEAGCTWAQLHEALKPKGLRTPFWGPLSGILSTIGGGVAQNNAFFGTGTYGPTGDSVVAMSVVLADGTLVRTGSAGTRNGAPFWRHYGPDLTGLFIGDSGAMGFKAEITLRLIPSPKHETWASYEFETRDGCAKAMTEIAKQNLACELFGFDPNLTKVRMARASILSDAKTLTNVMKAQGGLLKALREGAKVAMADRGFMADASYTLHFTVEGRSEAGLKEEISVLKALAEKHGGKAIENSIPKIIRANPFTPLNNMLGPQGERWVPIHGIVPISKGPACWKALEDGFERMADQFDKYNILTGALVTTMSTNGYLIEPVFIWPEELFEIHEAAVEGSVLSKYPRYKQNPDATAMVETARQFVLDTFSQFGAAHFQIGRTYPYVEGRDPDSLRLVETIKAALDPDCRVNPGVLGLG